MSNRMSLLRVVLPKAAGTLTNHRGEIVTLTRPDEPVLARLAVTATR